MKILFLTNSMGVGGIEWNLVRLSKELVRRGHEVLVGARPGNLTPALVSAGTRVVHLGFRLDPVTVARDVRRIRRVLRSEHPDVVHVFSASSGLLTWLARPRVPRVASVMGLQNSPDESLLRTRLRLWLTTLGAQRVLLPSPAIERLARQVGARGDRFVRQVVQGIEPPQDVGEAAAREEVRREFSIPAGAPVVATIGRLTASKSHELFIQAAHRLLEGRTDVHFLLVGGGELREALQAEVHRLGVQARVHLVGERHDIPRLLAASDVCVRPGIVEGFVGLTVLEAQALGVPVVAFETEDVRMAIEDGRTGLLVPPGDVQGLADAVERLLDDRELSARLGRAGQASMEERFSIHGIVDGLLRRYEDEMQPVPG